MYKEKGTKQKKKEESGKKRRMSTIGHNLDIDQYTKEEIRSLFDLHETYPLTENDLLHAKQKVYRLHPDKSKLPSEYFIFYRLAYTKLANEFEQQTKTTKRVTQQVYRANDSGAISTSIPSENDFNQKFNHLFERHMQKKPVAKDAWFSEETTSTISQVINKSNMNQVFESLRRSTSGQNALQNASSSTALGSHCCYFLEEEDEATYLSSNLFSKLKFDDLRRVHRDETVFNVSERDLPTTNHLSLEEKIQLRQKGSSISPLEREAAERLLAQEKEQHIQKMRMREEMAKDKSLEYAKKNDQILSYFLALPSSSSP